MKLGQVTKLDQKKQKNMATSKKNWNDFLRQIATSSPFFLFIANLEQSKRRMLEFH